MADYSLSVNGKQTTVSVDPDTPLLWVLRDTLDLVGTKYGCGIAQCGACTIHVDGQATRSCSLPVSQVKGRKITTIEGLDKEAKHPLQEAWRTHDVPQCGYCQAGQLMSAAALLKTNKKPSEEDIDNYLHGNLCRCASYTKIKAAVKTAAKNL